VIPTVPGSRGGPDLSKGQTRMGTSSPGQGPREPDRGLGSRGQISRAGPRPHSNRWPRASTALVRRPFDEAQATYLQWVVEMLLAVPLADGTADGGKRMAAAVDGQGNAALHLATGRQVPHGVIMRVLRADETAASRPNKAAQLPLQLYLAARLAPPDLGTVARLLEAYPRAAGEHAPPGGHRAYELAEIAGADVPIISLLAASVLSAEFMHTGHPSKALRACKVALTVVRTIEAAAPGEPPLAKVRALSRHFSSV
jgi:hypothetical protein